MNDSDKPDDDKPSTGNPDNKPESDRPGNGKPDGKEQYVFKNTLTSSSVKPSSGKPDDKPASGKPESGKPGSGKPSIKPSGGKPKPPTSGTIGDDSGKCTVRDKLMMGLKLKSLAAEQDDDQNDVKDFTKQQVKQLGKIWRKTIEKFADLHEKQGIPDVNFDCPNLDDFNTIDDVINFAVKQIDSHFEPFSKEHRMTTMNFNIIAKKFCVEGKKLSSLDIFIMPLKLCGNTKDYRFHVN